ncbi:MAG: penicillin-binding transpeptidase domain-containing protein [Cyclobacteriaceae bacterium]|nr:penicillin-binding transpeptidase domain-containing protein [Cyclobacteriaceae bacterium]
MIDNRKHIIRFIIVLTGLVFLIKLFFIQVLDSQYASAATNNIIQKTIEYPYRGLLYDRNGELLVFNDPQFDLTVVPNDVERLDTTAFCDLFDITLQVFKEKMQNAKEYSYVKSSVFIKQLSNEDFARVQDKLVDFPGFYVESRTARKYTHPLLANTLGYVSEITKRELEIDSVNYYNQGDYIGQSGIESFYEEQLRGKRGVKYKIKNVRGVEKGSFNEGKWDTLAIPGETLISTIDIKLQEYGEFLMKGKAGSIVSLEPKSGEVLAIVSGPSYDPNLLSGKKYSENFSIISSDTNKPLFNRPLMAQYRPGSIFKIVQAMIALQEGVITTKTRIPCNRDIIGCHGSHSNEDLQGAITHSCNPYFHNVMRRVVNKKVVENTFEDTHIGLDKWREHVMSFGFGKPLGIDLPNEKGGLIPSSAYYDRAYKDRPWKYSNIYSIAIGEGENMVVPIQMANFASIVANRGYYYIPHLIKSIDSLGNPLPQYQKKHYTTVDSAYFDVAVEAMAQVVKSGTGQYRAQLKNIEVCGKTGTVQNDPLPDHAVFIAFAPKDDPKIAVAVYVEDAGQGGRAAASIASLMIEQYLIGETERPWIEEYVLKGEFLY